MKKLLSFVVVFSLFVVLAGCGGKEELDLKVGRGLSAPHGTKSFATVTVALDGDEIIAVTLDEYQIGAKTDFTGVPNSDKDFGTNIAEGKVIYSKRENNTKYSSNMGGTKKLGESYDAIIEFALGKKVSELEDAIKGKTKEQMVDAVAGSTLVDTLGYLESILAVAKGAKAVDKVEVDKVDIKVAHTISDPHGTKSFGEVTVITNGDLIIAVTLDEYQIGAKTDFTGVPNSDKDFGTNVAEGKVIYSKRENNTKYSANMGGTKQLNESYDAIIKFALGKTVSELEDALKGKTKEQMVDAVAGSTLVDTLGYLNQILDTAKAAK